jgi:hypothetical protein
VDVDGTIGYRDAKCLDAAARADLAPLNAAARPDLAPPNAAARRRPAAHRDATGHDGATGRDGATGGDAAVERACQAIPVGPGATVGGVPRWRGGGSADLATAARGAPFGAAAA